MRATQIFNFLRGGVRSAFGVEDFRGKRIVVVGVGALGQELLSMLCFDNVKLFFFDKSVVNYHRAYQVCSSVCFLEKEEKGIDILINLDEGYLSIDGDFATKDFKLSEIGDDPYNQGIHEFYL
jgi:hypothetical protein